MSATVLATVQYRSYDKSGEAIERLLGDQFETHLPSENRTVARSDGGEVVIESGDVVELRVVRSAGRRSRPGTGAR